MLGQRDMQVGEHRTTQGHMSFELPAPVAPAAPSTTWAVTFTHTRW